MYRMLHLFEFGYEWEYAQAEFHFSSFSLRIVSSLASTINVISPSRSSPAPCAHAHWGDAHSFTYVTFYYISFIFVPLGLNEMVVACAFHLFSHHSESPLLLSLSLSQCVAYVFLVLVSFSFSFSFLCSVIFLYFLLSHSVSTLQHPLSFLSFFVLTILLLLSYLSLFVVVGYSVVSRTQN